MSHVAVELSDVKADLKDVEAGQTDKTVDESGAKTCDIYEHRMKGDELMKELKADRDAGLTTQEAQKRQDEDGLNQLTPKEGTWWLWKALAHVLGGFSLLLWAGSIMCLSVYGIDGSVENLTLGIVFFICAASMGYEILEAIIFTIGIIVANVPEGLLATVTVALTITAERMKDKNVLVKSTLIVETLGSVTAIASDKTGTLTQNRMSVRNAIYPDGTVRVTQHPRRRSIKETPVPLKMEAADEPFRPYYTSLVEIATICNHASFDDRSLDILQRTTDGDASESALLKFAHSNQDSDKIRKDFPEIA